MAHRTRHIYLTTRSCARPARLAVLAVLAAGLALSSRGRLVEATSRGRSLISPRTLPATDVVHMGVFAVAMQRLPGRFDAKNVGGDYSNHACVASSESQNLDGKSTQLKPTKTSLPHTSLLMSCTKDTSRLTRGVPRLNPLRVAVLAVLAVGLMALSRSQGGEGLVDAAAAVPAAQRSSLIGSRRFAAAFASLAYISTSFSLPRLRWRSKLRLGMVTILMSSMMQTCNSGDYCGPGEYCYTSAPSGSCYINGYCKSCYSGRYIEGSSYDVRTCKNCPTGKTTNGGTLDSSDDCMKCKSGYYCRSNDCSFHGGISCRACPKGWWGGGSSSSSARDSCNECAAGKFSNEDAQGFSTKLGTDIPTCKNCPAGKFQDNTHSSDCKTCASGKTHMKTGSKVATDCESCSDPVAQVLGAGTSLDTWGKDLSSKSELAIYSTSTEIYCTTKETTTEDPFIAVVDHIKSDGAYNGVSAIYEIRVKGLAQESTPAFVSHTANTSLKLAQPHGIPVGSPILCQVRARFQHEQTPNMIGEDVCSWSSWHDLAATTRSVQPFPMKRLDHENKLLFDACGGYKVEVTGVNFDKDETVDLLFFAETTGTTTWENYGKNQV